MAASSRLLPDAADRIDLEAAVRFKIHEVLLIVDRVLKQPAEYLAHHLRGELPPAPCERMYSRQKVSAVDHVQCTPVVGLATRLVVPRRPIAKCISKIVDKVTHF